MGEPTEQRKKDLLQFWDSFSRLYPCGECAKHMREKLKINPPKVENNKVYSQWLCGFHNEVTRMFIQKHILIMIAVIRINCSKDGNRMNFVDVIMNLLKELMVIHKQVIIEENQYLNIDTHEESILNLNTETWTVLIVEIVTVIF